jgi:hypothetical protein
MNNPDHISESELRNNFLGENTKVFDADPDPGSGIFFEPGSGLEKIRIRDP